MYRTSHLIHALPLRKLEDCLRSSGTPHKPWCPSTDFAGSMRAFTRGNATGQAISNNRRQPVRQTRTNTSRTTTNLALTAGVAGLAQQGADNEAPGFFPAITHFTDAITALPKEMIRHYTMLREVDAKICGPEEKLGQLLNAVFHTPSSTIYKSGAIEGMLKNP